MTQRILVPGGQYVVRRGFHGIMIDGEFVPFKAGGGVYGTLSTLDNIAATQQSVVEFGEDSVWRQFEVALAAHNEVRDELIGDFVEFTTDRLRRYGGLQTKEMQELDQYGRPQAQKITAGVTVGFPLRLYGDAVQWTRKFFQTPGSARQLAAEFTAILTADRRNMTLQIKRALFRSTNYTFNDVLIDNVELGVKALVNADGAAIPLGPNGAEFDGSTHTHYLATASFVAANLTSLINTVIEHHNQGLPIVFIPVGLEATVRGFTGFTAYIDARIVRGGGATTDVGNRALDMLNPNNRPIGFYGAAEIWVKPWMPANYALCMATEPGDRALALRERPGGSRNLTLVFDDETHPLRARGYESEFGIGVWNRTAAAILYTGGGTYVVPTLTA